MSESTFPCTQLAVGQLFLHGLKCRGLSRLEALMHTIRILQAKVGRKVTSDERHQPGKMCMEAISGKNAQAEDSKQSITCNQHIYGCNV